MKRQARVKIYVNVCKYIENMRQRIFLEISCTAPYEFPILHDLLIFHEVTRHFAKRQISLNFYGLYIICNRIIFRN